MRLTLTQLTDRIERVCDWRDDWEQRWDDAVAARWLADDELRRLEAEAELILRKQGALAHHADRRVAPRGAAGNATPQKEQVK